MRPDEHGQPVGDPVPGWTRRRRPGLQALVGRYGSVVPTDDRHVARLFDALVGNAPASLWTYIPAGPFPTLGDFEAYVAWFRHRPDAEQMTILDADERPVGIASYLRIDETHGSVEVGAITFSPALQRTATATEAMASMARHAFEDLGYRRYEWKCDL